MIILVGASASGKTAICKELIETYGFCKFVTTTTRDMRINEIQNVDYHFVTKEEFNNKIKNDEFIEYVTYANNYYGSEKKEIGDKKVIILEPLGLLSYLKMHDKRIVTFYIECKEDVRKKRMEERKDNPLDIEKRLENDKLVFTKDIENEVDFVIDSSSLSIKELADTIYFLYLSKIKS